MEADAEAAHAAGDEPADGDQEADVEEGEVD